MFSCGEFTPETLPNLVAAPGGDVGGFDDARAVADRTARDHLEEPMLLAWFDRKTGAFSPRVECCSEEKPGWVVYAETRGGSLTVDVGEGRFFFIFRDSE